MPRSTCFALPSKLVARSQTLFWSVPGVDGYEHENDLPAALTIAFDHVLLDVRGTSGLSDKGVNVRLSHATACSGFALRCITGPGIPGQRGVACTFSGYGSG